MTLRTIDPREAVRVTARAVINASTAGELRCCGQRWNGDRHVECGQLLLRFFRGADAPVEVMCRRCKSLAVGHLLFSTGRAAR